MFLARVYQTRPGRSPQGGFPETIGDDLASECLARYHIFIDRPKVDGSLGTSAGKVHGEEPFRSGESKGLESGSSVHTGANRSKASRFGEPLIRTAPEGQWHRASFRV